MKYRLMNVTALVTLVGGVLLASVTPDNILSISGLLRDFADWMTTWIPSIDNLTRLSRFPEVTKLVFSVMWAITPIIFLIFLYDMLKTPLSAMTFAKYVRFRIIATLGVYIMLPTLIVALALLIGESPPREVGTIADMVTREISNSRIWLGIVSAGISISVGFILTMIVFWTKLLPTLFRKVN